VNAGRRILCFGDSNTWGNTAGTPDRYPADVRWTGVLQRELGPGFLVIEEGYNGRTTVFPDYVENRLSGIDYFRTCLDSQSPLDLVVLMLGTNDLKVRFGVEAQSIAFAHSQYMEAIRSVPMAGQRPGLLVVSPIHLSPAYKDNPLFHGMFGEEGVERSKALAPALKSFAESVGAAFLDAADHARALDADGVHMGAEGHMSLGIALARKIRSLFPEER
jgi:lysophospholipase L1-like esterase